MARRSLRSIGEEDGPPCFTSIFSNLIITFRNVAEKNGSIGGGRIETRVLPNLRLEQSPLPR